MKLTFLIIFGLVFLIYIFGISHSVFGGDSGDIILAAWFGGVAHPPGYPLNTMIGYLFTHLPIGGTVAFRADIMAAFFQALNVLLIFLILKRLTKNIIISLCASLVLAFNPLFWLYAHTLEVFQLKIFLILVAQYFLLSWFDSKKKSYLYLSILFLGLAVFHHTMSLLTIPAFMYLFFRNDRNIFSNKMTLYKGISAFFIGAVPYAFVVFAAFRKTPINWDDPSNLTNLLRLATRADFGSFTATDFLVGQTLQMRLVQLLTFFGFLKNDFLVIGLLLIIIGFIYLYFKRRIVFWFYIILIFLNGPFFLFYSGFPLTNDFVFGIWERFLLEPYAYFVIPLAFGMLGIYEFIKAKLNSKLFRTIPLIAFMFLPLYLFLLNFNKTDLSKFEIGDQLGRDIFSSSKPNSVIFFLNDTMTFNSLYIYYTEGANLDRKVIQIGSLRHSYYRKQIMRGYPELRFNDHFKSDKIEDAYAFAADIITENRNNIDIYSTGDLSTEKSQWVPSGLLLKLVKEDEESILDTKAIISNFTFTDYNLGYQHFFGNYIVSLYYNSFVHAGNYLSIKSRQDDAELYFKKAIDISPRENSAYVNLAASQISNKKCELAKQNIEKAKAINSLDLTYLRVLLAYERDCNKNENAVGQIQELIDNKSGSEKF